MVFVIRNAWRHNLQQWTFIYERNFQN